MVIDNGADPADVSALGAEAKVPHSCDGSDRASNFGVEIRLGCISRKGMSASAMNNKG